MHTPHAHVQDCADVDEWKQNVDFEGLLDPPLAALEELLPEAKAEHRVYVKRQLALARIDDSQLGNLTKVFDKMQKIVAAGEIGEA